MPGKDIIELFKIKNYRKGSKGHAKERNVVSPNPLRPLRNPAYRQAGIANLCDTKISNKLSCPFQTLQNIIFAHA